MIGVGGTGRVGTAPAVGAAELVGGIGVEPLVADLEPGNSMGKAMLAWCLYRQGEFSPRKLPTQVSTEIIALTNKAVSLDPSSYFARLIDALTRPGYAGRV